MKKTPRELKQEIDNPEGGARFKARYYTNLRAALGVSKCQTCGNKKIEVLTDSSLLLCGQCFNKGKHIIADQLTGELIGNIGWATAQGKLKKLSSQASLENEEDEDYRPPPALSQRSVSKRRQSRSPESHNRGRSKTPRTESQQNPSAQKAPQYPNEPLEIPAEEQIDIEYECMSPTSQVAAAFGALSPYK